LTGFPNISGDANRSAPGSPHDGERNGTLPNFCRVFSQLSALSIEIVRQSLQF
jgi:hypothetical protein